MIALFVLVVIVVTLALNAVIPNAIVAVIAAVIISVIGFQVFAYLHLGYLDPFFQVAAAVQTIIGVAVASATVGIFKAARKSHKRKSPRKTQ